MNRTPNQRSAPAAAGPSSCPGKAHIIWLGSWLKHYLWVWILLGSAAAMVGLVARDYADSMLRRDCTLLNGTHTAWKKAGKPVGAAFEKFITGRPEVTPSDRTLVVNGQEWKTELAYTNLVGGDPGRLYITEAGVILLENPDRRAKLVTVRYRRDGP